MMNKIVICTVKSALWDILKPTMQFQDELNAINKNIKTFKKFFKTTDYEYVEPDLIQTVDKTYMDIETIPDCILRDKLYFYREQYVDESANLLSTSDIFTLEFLKENRYLLNFSIGNMYINAVYLSHILEQIIINNIDDLVYMLYYHHYYIWDDNFRRFPVSKYDEMKYDIERDYFRDIIMLFLQNYKNSSYKNKCITELQKMFIGMPTRYYNRIIELVTENEAYFKQIKLTVDILKGVNKNGK